MTLIAQVASVIAALILLTSYWLLSHDKLSVHKKNYHLLILLASLLMGFSSIVIFNIGSLLINGAFIVLALMSLRRVRK